MTSRGALIQVQNIDQSLSGTDQWGTAEKAVPKGSQPDVKRSDIVEPIQNFQKNFWKCWLISVNGFN